MWATMDMWRNQKPRRRKCQFCKRQRLCKHGPDPFLFYNFDDMEMVWLCEECYSLRENGDHLDDMDEDWGTV